MTLLAGPPAIHVLGRRFLARIVPVVVALVVAFVSPVFAGDEAAPAEAPSAQEGYDAFPRDELFEALAADPRWPRFAVTHEWRLGTDEFDRVANVSFGESFSFVRSPEFEWGQWEFGLQAMVDATFDLTASSFDLSNEDYFVGLVFSFLVDDVTTQLRVSHMSSHVGDEYLLANSLSRESVSYEVIDLLASYDLREWLRIYGGAGVYVSPEPDFDPLLMQLGFEWKSPVHFAEGRVTPIVATDLQLRQANGFTPEVSVLGGFRFADPAEPERHLELFTRFYHGRSPDGQFFRQTVDIIGLGLRLGF